MRPLLPLRPLRLDIWSDIACPWCYVGKRRLERALLETPNAPVTIHWRAFQLQSQLPAEGVDPARFFAAKFGSEQRRDALFVRMRELGLADGIDFDFAHMRAPNTLLAHRIAKLAPAGPSQQRTIAALFRAHFERGVDVGNLDEILAFLTAESVLEDVHGLRARLLAGDGLAEVLADQNEAHALGITGVPFFLANGEIALSGAQPSEVFVDFLAEARARAQHESELAALQDPAERDRNGPSAVSG